MKLFIQNFFSICDQIRKNLVIFTGKFLNGKLHFCTVIWEKRKIENRKRHKQSLTKKVFNNFWIAIIKFES